MSTATLQDAATEARRRAEDAQRKAAEAQAAAWASPSRRPGRQPTHGSNVMPSRPSRASMLTTPHPRSAWLRHGRRSISRP